MKLTLLERFEEDFAVIEVDGVIKVIPRLLVGPQVNEGDVLHWNGESWITDAEATAARTAAMQKLMKDVWGD
jgi:hypothetical protein